MAYILLPAEQYEVPLPVDVFPCPICGAALMAEIDTWSRPDDGAHWQAADEGLSLTCTTAPDIDSDAWAAWHRWHYRMPYVDWLLLEAPVLAWVNARYRWQREGA